MDRPEVVRWARAAVIWLRRTGYRRRMKVGSGTSSRYGAGDWVRVGDAREIRTMLDSGGKTRGLLFTDEQWSYCGRTFRVAKVVRRMLDNRWRMSPIASAVILDRVTCDGLKGTGGCGRSCALIFKDEWLEPSGPESATLEVPTAARSSGVRGQVQIKTADAIKKTLGADGRLDGMSSPPSFARLAGTVHDVTRTWDSRTDHLTATCKAPRARWFILDSLRCDGSVLTDRVIGGAHCSGMSPGSNLEGIRPGDTSAAAATMVTPVTWPSIGS
jgi:hypothetical protein